MKGEDEVGAAPNGDAGVLPKALAEDPPNGEAGVLPKGAAELPNGVEEDPLDAPNMLEAG